MTACYQGVLLSLPIEKQFGYAYVVLYNTKITRIINGCEIQE
jgi:recombinational DNA repair protein RecT